MSNNQQIGKQGTLKPQHLCAEFTSTCRLWIIACWPPIPVRLPAELSGWAAIPSALLLSADLSSLPTIILRRFLFTNDPAYLLLSVALGDVFLLPPPLLCGILFTLHKKTRKSVPDQSFALSHHTNSSWGATLVSFLMHLPQLLHCYDTGKSDLYQVKPTALF